RTGYGTGIRINRASAVTEFPDEAITKAGEFRSPRFVESQIVKKAPRCDGYPCQTRAADSTEPAHQGRGITSGNPVRQEKIDVLLEKDTCQRQGGAASHHQGELINRSLRFCATPVTFFRQTQLASASVAGRYAEFRRDDYGGLFFYRL